MNNLLAAQPLMLAVDPSEFGTNQVLAGGKLINKIEELLIGSVTLPPKDEFLKIVGDAYDKYVAPIDLPGFGPLTEPAADAALKYVTVAVAGRLYDFYARKKQAA